MGKQVQVLPSGVEVWTAGGKDYFAARIPILESQPTRLHCRCYRTTPKFLTRYTEIQSYTREYYQEKQDLRALKRQCF